MNMYLLTKEADELAIVFSPEERLRIGDTLDIDGIVAQVVDIQFADLPGVLEHILRKSLISKSEVKEHIQPEVKSVIDSLTDQRLAIAKIRGRLVEANVNGNKKRVFKTGLSEFNISRAKAKINVLDQTELFNALGLRFPDSCDFALTLSSDPKPFDLLAERLGINLITGMKGSGKSYSAKRLLLKLVERKVLTIVFDLNGEYLNLWKADEKTESKYCSLVRIFTPRLSRARAHELPFCIPLNEITYDDFATFVNVAQGSPTYQHLMQFWRDRGQTQFDLNDLETFVNSPQHVQNDAVRAALQGRVQAARALGLFGPSNLANLIVEMHRTGGVMVINLAQVGQWERSIIVEFVLRKLAQLGQSGDIRAVSLFLEEAQLYVDQQKMINILTRMRHLGIFPTFITNDPRTLPDEVYTLLDNLVAFMFKNEDELRQLAKSGFIDLKSINSLKHLENKQCIVVGNVTSNYPVFVEVNPQSGVVMGGETRRLVG
jgi:hypothetical protein